MKNRFNGHQLADREQEELWNDIRDIVKETANKMVRKAKRKKVTKWLSDEAVKIADERREVRNKGDDKEYRRLNAAFQRRARQDQEQSIKEKCKLKMWNHEAEHGEGGNGREGGDIYMAAIHGRTVQKGPKRNGLFQRNIYEDEPEVVEVEVKETLRYII